MKFIELWVTEFPAPIYVNANCIEQIYPGGPETVLVKLTSGQVYELSTPCGDDEDYYEVVVEEIIAGVKLQMQ